MVDLEKLLAPLSEENPAGPNLRAAAGDTTFGAIEELRREADPATDLEGGKAANWPAVVRACEQALATQSKDLQLAAWLVEAQARTEGFAGLQAGLGLVRSLLDRFWETLHPGPEGGEIVLPLRARPLLWMTAPRGMLPSVQAIPFLGADDRKRDEWLGWKAYLESESVDQAFVANQARYQEMVDAGAVTRARFEGEFKATPIARLRGEAATIRATEAEIQALEELCAARFGSDEAPSFLELRALLSDIREYIESHLPPETSGEVGSGEADAAAAPGVITARQEALDRLREVAEFFRRTEPHSPLAHLIERAARWGSMSFEEVLRDVVKNNEALASVWETLGIKPPSE